MREKYIKNMDHGKVLDFNSLISYVDGGVESRTLVQREDFSMTLFAFDQKEGVSAYSMPGDTLINVREGKAEVTIDEDKKVVLHQGKTIVVPPNVLHSIDVLEKSKLMIIIVKSNKGVD